MDERRLLIVMRHAKAGDLPGGPDAERALRPRGRRDATAAGQWLASQQIVPDLVLCSAARRARQTWQGVSAELDRPPQAHIDPRLYQAGAIELLDIMADTPEQTASVMYVGHNPAAADLVETLTSQPVDCPTSAIAIIGLDLGWPELSGGAAAGCGELVAFWSPTRSLPYPGRARLSAQEDAYAG